MNYATKENYNASQHDENTQSVDVGFNFLLSSTVPSHSENG